MPFDWKKLIKQWPGFPDYDATLIERAVKRLEADDVRLTKYGMRVQCRDDLGDNRQAAAAYWPRLVDDEWSCKCWSWKADGQCSHVIAVRVWLWSQERQKRQQAFF